MDLENKTKDNINSRFDLAYMGIYTSRASCDYEWRRKIHISVCMFYHVISVKTCILSISSSRWLFI